MGDSDYTFYPAKQEAAEGDPSIQYNNDVIFEKLTKRNNIAYIESRDNEEKVYATKYISDLRYWKITEDINEADFILNFMGRYNGYGTWVQQIICL